MINLVSKFGMVEYAIVFQRYRIRLTVMLYGFLGFWSFVWILDNYNANIGTDMKLFYRQSNRAVVDVFLIERINQNSSNFRVTNLF